MIEQREEQRKAQIFWRNYSHNSLKNDELWLEAIRVEMRANNPKMAQTLLSKALQECPENFRYTRQETAKKNLRPH